MLLRKSRPPVNQKEIGQYWPGQIVASNWSDVCIRVGGRWLTAKQQDVLPLTEDELNRYVSDTKDKVIRVADNSLIPELAAEPTTLETLFSQIPQIVNW